MLARDVDSNPTQYRTWVVPNTPDFTGEYYTGLKSGDNPFVDVSAYLVLDGYDGYSLDFNYPLATLYPNALNWGTTRKVLPEAVYDGQLCVADGYAYIFGGNGSDKIFKADLNNPCDWEDTQAILPNELYGSQLAIIDGYIYLFGGNNGSTSNNIYSAPISDPLNWTDHGPLLPKNIESSQLAIIDGYIYLFGGSDGYSTISNILKADVSTPLVWQDTGYNLPVSLRSSHLGIIDGYVYLFGGITSSNNPTDLIYRAELLDPTSWGLIGALPYAICNGNFFTIGAQGYLIAPGSDPGVQTYQTKIFKCNLSTPYSWVDTKKTIPGDISYSQLAVIYDRVFLFGGNGNSVIYSNKSIFKYSFGDPKITIYDDVTRTQYNSTPNVLDLFKVIGFQPWRTDYGS